MKSNKTQKHQKIKANNNNTYFQQKHKDPHFIN